MKRHLILDEMYPVYKFSDEKHYRVEPAEFTDAEIARIEAAWVEWEACQKLIAERFGVE
ncbi:MAG: hypothetical protein V4773_11995 [Verrucomicrobiota bacterium]